MQHFPMSQSLTIFTTKHVDMTTNFNSTLLPNYNTSLSRITSGLVLLILAPRHVLNNRSFNTEISKTPAKMSTIRTYNNPLQENKLFGNIYKT